MAAECAVDVPLRQTNWRGVHLRVARADGSCASEAFVAPELGCNLLSFVVDGTDYIYAGDAEQPPKLLGSPILYPTPNRVRNGRMTFEARVFTFQPNMGPHFIHGLVRDQRWEAEPPMAEGERAGLTARIHFAPGSAAYEVFPIANVLQVTYTLVPGVVRMDWLVRNEDSSQRLPFGLAIHPYFPIIGTRASVRIRVPARRWMEALDLMPTGKLVDLRKGPADLRRSRSLEQLDIDDVFWGMQPNGPATIDYDSLGRRVTLVASELFTHAVVYTPRGRGYFCIENQSCSTDAHNLYAQGQQEAAHLTILEPGQELRAWIELRVSTH